MTHVKTSSKALLLACLPLLALTGIILKGRPHPQQVTYSRLSSSRLSSSQPLGTAHVYLKGNQSMANQQLIKGGAAVAITNVQPGAAAGSGQSYPGAQSIPSANIYNGSNLLWTGGLTTALPSTQNGITVSAITTTGPGFVATLTAAATSSAPVATSLTILTSSGGTTTSGVFDVVAALVAPTGVTATPQAGLGVVINCTNATSQPPGTTFNLLESTTAGGEGTTPVASGITLSYMRQEATAGQNFYILQAQNGTATANSAEVSAFAYDQASGFSNTASATPSVPAPGAVTGLTATLTDNGTAPSIALAWALPTSGQAITGINVRSGSASGGESTAPLNAAQLAASATSFAFQAAYNQDYFLVVDTIDAGGTATSAEVHIKTDVAAPTNLTATGGNNQTVLRWANNTGTLGEMIQYSLDNVNWNNLITLATVVGTYTDTAATNGVKRYYRLADLN